MLAPQAVNEVKPKVLAPKQTKLLGATVRDVGTITTVSAELPWCFCLIERPDGSEAHAFIRDLRKNTLTFPNKPQPYRALTRRIGFGLWADVYELESVHVSDLTHVDPLERAA